MQSDINVVTAPTVAVRVYIAGDLSDIRRAVRAFCMEGLCVTVTPTTFVFTGGAEEGVEIGLVNYPRFPTDAATLTDTAVRLARFLVVEACQSSALVVAPCGTQWLTRRDRYGR